MEVFINSYFFAWIIFDKFQLETRQFDTYCPVDFVQFGKTDQFLSKAQMVHIMLYFPTYLEHSDQGRRRLDPYSPYKDDIQIFINSINYFY